MVAIWIAGALLLGLAVSRIGLPPLVGFLASGFVFAALGMERAPLLADLAHAGVLLLLFAVGLKLRIKTLLRYEVWGTAISHLLLTGIIGVARPRSAAGSSPGLALALAVSFGFSSTVLAAKVLEGNRELRAVHGRVAIGILIVQDVVAVVLLAFITLETPSPYALLLLLVPLARPVIAWLLGRCGHGELLVLFGAALAIGGGEGVRGARLERRARRAAARHDARGSQALARAHERALGAQGAVPRRVLLEHRLQRPADVGGADERAAGSSLLLPVQGAIFFLLLIGLGLRARTSFLTAVSLTTYSEFALIVVDVAVNNGLLGTQWVVVTALAVALSFVAAAPLNAFAHQLFRWASPWLERLERDKRHPDDEPISLGRAEILIVGMGRVGAGAYDYLRQQDENIVGIDSDPGKIESNVREGRRVAYADAEDPSFWHLLNIDRLRAIMLAVPDFQAKVSAARALRRRGYRGLLSATHLFPEEREPIIEAGCDVTYNYYTEAGVGFARHTYETLRPPRRRERSGQARESTPVPVALRRAPAAQVHI